MPSAWARTATSYSGVDMRAVVNIEGQGAQVIGNLQTLSCSIHRDKMPVRALGYTRRKSTTRATRTIAGSLIFLTFDRYALYSIMRSKASLDRGRGEQYLSLFGDQVMPFDINCVFINEMGRQSQLNLYGVELEDEGNVISINDIYTESTHSFTADDMDVLFPTDQGAWTDNSQLPFFPAGLGFTFYASPGGT